MKTMPPQPTALASTHISRTKSGVTLVRVRIITATGIHFRTYPIHPDSLRVISAALKSCSIPAAWVQGELLALPVGRG